MLRIDEYAYKSPLRWIDPKGKLIFGFTALVLNLCLSSYGVSVFIIVTMAILAVKVSKLTVKKYLKMMCIPLVFLIIGTVTVIINRYPLNVDLLWGIDIYSHSYGISIEKLQFGLLLILKCLGAVSCMYFICINTPLPDIMGAMSSMKVPLLIVNLMELIYRYIFVLIDEANRMKIAQDSRMGHRKFKSSLKSMGELAGTLFLRTYMRSDRIFAALQSRGYEGQFQTLVPSYESSHKWLFGAFVFSLIIILLFWAERIIL